MQINTTIFRKILGVLLLTLFVGYFVGITFFPHKHVVNGVVIVHSHPFSSNEHHAHSTNVLNWLQQLSQILTKVFVSGVLLSALLSVKSIIEIFDALFSYAGNYKYSYFSRPPPLNL